MKRTPSRATMGRWRSLGIAAALVVLSAGTVGCRKDAPELAASTGVAPAALPPSVRPAAVAPVVDLIPPHVVAPLTARENVGLSIFLDATLSEPSGTSCASCHDPGMAFSGNNGSPVGVARGSRPGHFARRNTPSVFYMKYVPAFHFALEDDDDVEESPFGGLGWIGRADTVSEFVRLPLFDADEMNNKSEAAIAEKLRAAPYVNDLVREFPGALDSAASAVKALADALQAFLTSDHMAPFTSKFDDFLRGKAQLSPLETRGMQAFRNREKGACASCHQMYERSNRPESSLFTTYTYDAVGVPRNGAIPANSDTARFDLGLCERSKKDPRSSAAKWCGSFRIPSLRNVAVRERFMHNGAFTTLRQTVEFYATRAVNPGRWYPPRNAFDDLPAKYKGNVNTMAFPYHRPEGGPAPLDDGDIDAIVAFLKTLTDEPYRSQMQ